MKTTASIYKIAYKSALYYRRLGIVTALGLALAGAVTTGSIMIGDSVRGSIQHMSSARLGRITYALKPQRFIRAQMADDIGRLAQNSKKTLNASAAILVRGVVENQDSGEAVPLVNIIAADRNFNKFYPNRDLPPVQPGRALINESLARDLHVKTGDSILVSTDRQSSMRAGNLFAHVDPVYNQRSLTVTVDRILRDTGPGGFRLDSSTQIPRNVYVSLDELSEAMGKKGKANTLFFAGSQLNSKEIMDLAGKVSQPEDLGISVISKSDSGRLILYSDSIVFQNTGTGSLNIPDDSTREIYSVYLADSMKSPRTGKTLYYSVVAAAQPGLEFKFISRNSRLDSSGIYLNSWAARDMGAKVGDQIEVQYLKAKRDGTYEKRSFNRVVQGIVDISGAAADRAMVPDFEGITDAATIGDWKSPFPLDLKKVTQSDELYWNKYRAIPKAYLDSQSLEEMWRSEDGYSKDWITGISYNNPNLTKSKLETAISGQHLAGAVMNLASDARRASQGSTDLASVFIGLGVFLIYACAALAGSLVRVSVTGKAKNVGIMLAEGFSQKQTSIIVFLQWSIWVVIGSLAAVPLGLLYAQGVVYALNSWWRNAVGQAVLWLTVAPSSLVLGCISTLLLGAITLILALRGISTRPVVDLLHQRSPVKKLRKSLHIKLGSSAVIVICLIIGCIAYALGPTYGLIVTAPVCIIAGLLMASIPMQPMLEKNRSRILKFSRVACGEVGKGSGFNAAVQISVAALILTMVASQVRTTIGNSPDDINSGTGGYTLQCIASMPLGYDLGTPEGRMKLGFQPQDEKLFRNVRVTAMLSADGDDISCLNLAKPGQPGILGIPQKMADRGGFGLDSSKWRMMESDSDTIRAFGDADSLEWNLKKRVGDNLSITDDSGKQRNIRIAGVIHRSLFAGELLVSEKQFLRMFPSRSQPKYYLIKCPQSNAKTLARTLRQVLGSSGLEVKTTSEVVNSFAGVQNTYIAVLMSLGAFALVLGAGGQMIAVMRSASQKRSTYALMLAIGFSRSDIYRALIYEHAIVPGMTVACTLISFFIIMIPAWIKGSLIPNWQWPLLVLILISVISYISCFIAAQRSISQDLIQALRSE